MALRSAAILESAGDRPVHPQGQGFAPGGYFHHVPLAGGLDAALFHILLSAEEPFASLGGTGLAEEVPTRGVAELGLMPEIAVLGIADVRAAVIAAPALNLGVAKLEMEDRVPVFLLGQQHVVAAVAVADQHPAGSVHMPLVTAQLAVARDRHAVPAGQIGARHDVLPPLGVGLEGTSRAALLGG